MMILFLEKNKFLNSKKVIIPTAIVVILGIIVLGVYTYGMVNKNLFSGSLRHASVAQLSPCNGADANRNGIVDFEDYNRWFSNNGKTCVFPSYCDGADMTKNGIVDFEDYNMWFSNNGETCLPSSYIYIYDNTAGVFVSGQGEIAGTNNYFITPNNTGGGSTSWPLNLDSGTKARINVPAQDAIYDKFWFQTSPQLTAPFDHTFYYDGVSVTLVPPDPYKDAPAWEWWSSNTGNRAWLFYKSGNWNNYLYIKSDKNKTGTQFRMDLTPVVASPPHYYTGLYNSSVDKNITVALPTNPTFIDITCWHKNVKVVCDAPMGVFTVPDNIYLYEPASALYPGQSYYFIPAGSYKATASYGGVTKNKTVLVSPGNHFAVRFDF